MGLMAFPTEGIHRRTTRRAIWVLAIVLVSLVLLPSCGGGGSSSIQQNPPSPGTPPGTYTLMLTGSSGSVSHSVPISLTVQ
jgi:hypothetical protein